MTTHAIASLSLMRFRDGSSAAQSQLSSCCHGQGLALRKMLQNVANEMRHFGALEPHKYCLNTWALHPKPPQAGESGRPAPPPMTAKQLDALKNDAKFIA
jgi:hypothetical protein